MIMMTLIMIKQSVYTCYNDL